MTLSTTWAKPDSPAAIRWCQISGELDGSVHTVCGGRWSSSDTAAIHQDPPLKERCLACVRGAVEVPFDDLLDPPICEQPCEHADCATVRPYVQPEWDPQTTPTVSGRRAVVEFDLDGAEMEWIGGEG